MPAWVPLVLVAMLVCGGAIGVAVDRTLLHRGWRDGRGMMSGPMRRGPMGPPSAGRRAEMRERIARELGLTPEQQGKVDAILERQFTTLEATYATVRPRLDSIFESTREALDSVLTPAQRETRDRLFRQRGGPGGRGRGRFGGPADGAMRGPPMMPPGGPPPPPAP
ncbi:MAG: hypothetical protein MUF00_00660 [Gemmatimonadaceae bacterium]|nr:hypothetical protein [Gemmatimonadaceae bacterium]